MAAKMEQTPETSTNPVLSVDKNGCVLYSNEAGNLLLNEWGVRVGEKLPSSIVDIVQKVISLNSPEKTEVEVGKRVYLVVFQPFPDQDQECVIISGFDISDQKEVEGNLHIKEKQNDVLHQIGKIALEYDSLQTFLDESVKLIASTLDLEYCKIIEFLPEGKFLMRAGTGWKPEFVGKPFVDGGIESQARYTLLSGMPAIVENFEEEQRFDKPEILRIHGVASGASVIIGRKENIFGVLIVNSTKKRKFTSNDTYFLSSVAVLIAQVIERINAEKTLWLSSIYNRSLIEASLDPFVTIGNDGNVTDVNKATEQATGYSRYDLIGTYFAQYLSEPDQAISAFVSVCTHGELRDCALEIKHRNGHITPVLCNASVYRDENGKVIGVFVAARDITERKKAEEALKKAHDSLEEKVKERTKELEKAYNSMKESEERLAEAQKMAHVGSWVWDRATDKAYWSDELYRIFGRDPREPGVTYNELFNCIHPDDREYVNNAIKKALDGKAFNYEYRIVLANGEERTVHMESKIIFEENDIPIHFKGIIQDITERIKAEEKIKRLANIVENTNDGIGLITQEGIVLEWNKGEERIYGYDVGDIVGRHISILAPPNSKNEPMDHIELIKQTRTSYNYTASRLRKDGKTVEVSITLAPVFDSHGKLTAISFITRDITEQKRAEEKLRESEEKYRNIVETANEGILITDDESVATYVNKRFADMLRYTPEELTGKSTWGLIIEEYKPVVKMNLDKRRQGISNSYELKLIRKDGYPIWTIINAKPLFDDDGKYIGAMSMFTDITEWKETEEALKNFEIARQKEIHHRIKNNLQVISSLLDLQADKFTSRGCIKDSEVLEAFRESQDRVTTMALIHEELYKGGGFETLNFSTYIEELAENLFKTYNIGNNDIRLKLDLAENTFFDMDIAVPLGMIVNELVTNSFKHAFPDEKEGEIRIKLHKEESENCSSAFILTVSDDGIGISEDIDIENLDSLGLQLVTTLVDQIDGQLELKRNNGTEFIIRFTVTEKNLESKASLTQLANNN